MTLRAPAIALLLVVTACGGPIGTGTPDSGPSEPSATPATSPLASPTTAPSPAVTASTPPEPLRWQALDSAGPAAREDHTWTVAGDGRTALLFGGRDGATVFGDMWAYDLRDDGWAQLSVEGGPAPRFGHEAAWVEDVGLVVFAGQAGVEFFNDLWAYDPDAGRWTELPAAGEVPVGRYGSCAALGPDGRLWISHGFTADGVRFSDTRAYDFAAGHWTDETPDGTRPVERCLHGCWWTDDGDLALYAGQTTGTTALTDRWLLGDGAWAMVEGALPPERNLYARTRIDGATLVFGGQALDGSYRADLWLLTDRSSDAVELPIEGDRPAGRAGAEMVRDVEGGRTVLFGGRGADGVLADAWAVTGALPAP